ncbi:MAG TPA: STAS domain-containing protein [Gemmatimonadaceae bacterium]|jgi:anti-sigma B factor antagonist|nr:STAS domain-containing protein [Gemmatimonadaceae bacterium]
MSFRTTKQGDVVVVAVDGQLVAGNRQQLREAIVSEIDRGAHSFVIDFAEAGYVDSAGLGALVSLSKRIRESSGSLRLTNLNEDLRTLFELTRLDTLFALDDKNEQAGTAADLRPKPAPRQDEGEPWRRSDPDARP